MKIFLFAIIISCTGLFAQQKEAMKLQRVEQSGFIGVDKAPELISQVKQEYPQHAKYLGVQRKYYLNL